MKINKVSLLPIAVLAVLGLVIGFASPGYAAPHYSVGDVTLMSAPGVTVVGSTPYSPKATCGTAACHNYESNIALATKNNGTGQPSYQVPYPQHGVTAGYHFQQGRNLDWDNAQREHFHQADFTSSGGMYGKY